MKLSLTISRPLAMDRSSLSLQNCSETRLAQVLRSVKLPLKLGRQHRSIAWLRLAWSEGAVLTTSFASVVVKLMEDMTDRLLRCFSSIFPILSPDEILTADVEQLVETDSLAGVS